VIGIEQSFFRLLDSRVKPGVCARFFHLGHFEIINHSTKHLFGVRLLALNLYDCRLIGMVPFRYGDIPGRLLDVVHFFELYDVVAVVAVVDGRTDNQVFGLVNLDAVFREEATYVIDDL
jgi:hypothetical protein